jgi:16S rRNA (guanine966-N2)-methyltransferase
VRHVSRNLPHLLLTRAMRVIGGNARGRRLKAPKGRMLRPTSARVKEALFNILPRDLSGMHALDLFAGTGNIAIEALSRGLTQALLVDASAESARAIRANLHALGLAHQARLWNMPVEQALRRLERLGEAFDLVFIDPPYGRNLVERTLKMIARTSILRPAGTIVAEHSARDSILRYYGRLELRDQRRYGDTMLSFFHWRGDDNSEVRTPVHGTT